MIKYLLLLTLPIISNAHNPELKEKCDFESLKGEWYGDFTFYTGTRFIMYMQVEEVKKCEIKGTFIWPNYYNSKTRFEGHLEDNHLILKEVEILEGMVMDIDKSYYKVPLNLTDTISGVAYSEDEDVATFRVIRKEHLSPEKLQCYQETFDEMAAIYGDTKILGPADIKANELKESYQKLTQKNFPDQPLRMTGTATVNQLNLDLLMLLAPPDRFYMEFAFQNVKYLSGKHDKISWSYDPFNDLVTYKELDSTETDKEAFENNFLKALDDVVDLNVKNAMLDDTPAYRVWVRNDDDQLETYYISKESGQIIREERNYQVTLFSDYKSYDGFWFPNVFKQVQPDGEVFQFSLDQVEYAQVDSTLFYIPAHLKKKFDSQAEVASVIDLADEAFENKDHKRAIELYTKALDQYPYNDNLFFKRGISKYELGENYGAISDFERAIDLNDEVADYYNRRGLVKFRLKDYENATKDFVKAVAHDSTMSIAYFNIAYTLSEVNQPDTALLFITKALELDPDNGQFQLNHGLIHFRLKNYRQALDSYLETLRLEYGDLPSLQNRIGVAYYNLEDYDSATMYFKWAADADPKNNQYAKNLGRSYKRTERFKDAIQVLETLDEDQRDHDILNELAMAYYGVEDYESALFYINKCIEAQKNNPTYHDNRAYIHTQLMKYQEAIRDFSRSIELYPDDAEVYFQRGLLNKIQNNRHDACSDFNKASEMGHETAKKELTDFCYSSLQPQASDN